MRPKLDKLMVVQSQSFCPFDDREGGIQSKPNHAVFDEALSQVLSWASTRVKREGLEGFLTRIDVEL